MSRRHQFAKNDEHPTQYEFALVYSSQSLHAVSSTGSEQSVHPAEVLVHTWYRLRTRYFPERIDLDDYRIEWSTRKQKRVLASCDIHGRRVRVARELARPEYYRYLSPLLYHEMCHAVIGQNVEVHRGVRLWHGPQFKELESRHPESDLLQKWITAGGWQTAVRRDRAFEAARKRKQ